ncbi:membrane-bound lytic murein transglycosylase MltF [Alteromonas sp. ASW11-130]|uniref:membrane-bound lytic murein transglycosylase MltF n=1 Tax=Alteromonas sp. ASW11-130 TaxID=3015775 RepID=UPI0022423D24|nr:membrane-bound lytic murein transglycosylase MltF [Alteromonas sp. ASW11-130]MCW8091828.1 membrane-bound lytic murein transglycosylase MltF [Alteromonas sp. ASW11-130]
MKSIRFFTFRYLFILLAGLTLTSCQPYYIPNSLNSLVAGKVLKLATVYGRTTYYIGPDGPLGFEYELAKGFADYLGIELQVYPFYSYPALLAQIKSGHMDIGASGDAITSAVSKQFKLGPAYQQVSHKLVFRQGDQRPRTLADIDDTLLVVEGSSHAQTLLHETSEKPDLSWQSTPDKDAEELLQMVAEGALPYTLADSNALAIQRRRYPQLSIGFTVRPLLPVAWLLNPNQDDSLRAALIEYFGLIQQNGRFRVLEDKYFGHVRKFNYVDTRSFIEAANTELPLYKKWFKQYADDIDWRLLAAMSYQESHWQPDAVSVTGVKGLMMLTRNTAMDMNVTSRIDAEQSIRGGAQYFSSLVSRIPDRIPHPDRIWMALAAYNIGMGHLEDARVLTERQGANPDLWVEVKQRLPLLRQKKYYRTTKYGYARGDEAKQYVENIRRYFDTLVWLEERHSAGLKEEEKRPTKFMPSP